jgi:DNA-binding NarL/FixJ family response regulator
MGRAAAGSHTGGVAHKKPKQVRRRDPLTARELEVLALVALGEPTSAISRRPGIRQSTVKTHLTRWSSRSN